MKVLEINAVPYGSTARIAYSIAHAGEMAGIDVRTSFGYSYHPVYDNNILTYHIGNPFDKLVHLVLSKTLLGDDGDFSFFTTLLFLEKIKKIKPDIIHLHNIHGHCINYSLLFRYIKKHHIKVVWTLHDCWSFTGHCSHYDMIGCPKWKNGCKDCPLYENRLLKRQVHKSFIYKRDSFNGVEDMIIVTPSKWLSSQISQSFLSGYIVLTINNGINLDVFRCTNTRTPSKLENPTLLGVAMGWDNKKGLDVFIELREQLDSSFRIVLVGTNEKVDALLPPGIESIHRVDNMEALVELYNSADFFVNVTREDTFPTVNIEALACGLPVLTFNTGGSPEIIDEKTGKVFEKNDVDSLLLFLKKKDQLFYSSDCLKRARLYDARQKYDEYIKLYKHSL